MGYEIISGFKATIDWFPNSQNFSKYMSKIYNA